MDRNKQLFIKVNKALML